ncbi:MAG: helix-turn-helix domain-containing protein [Clostridia bacterium]|jgi:transcriptional regulator with XRE-family HTH domain
MRVEILVKKIRIEKGYTIDKVAQLAKMSKGHLSRIERGETEPTISTLARLAMALKVDVNDLYKIHY